MKSLLFAKRNLTEMVRDPLLYIFCAVFPVAMLIMFTIITKYTADAPLVFALPSLVPGIMMFSYSLLMLMSSLLVSKDKSTAFLKRLFTSPMKDYQFIIGYFITFFLVGLVQNIICIAAAYIVSAITSSSFVSFSGALLLCLEMIPMLIINIMIGMILGTLLNDKSAPAMTSIFISACGVIGGAWMPVDTMGNFEKFCGYLPFYPSVYLGRIITGAKHTLGNLYEFNNTAIHYVGIISVFLLLTTTLALLCFKKTMKSE